MLSRCGRCKSALYCSSSCQKNDWKTHKNTCNNITNSNMDAPIAAPITNNNKHSNNKRSNPHITASFLPKGMDMGDMSEEDMHMLNDMYNKGMLPSDMMSAMGQGGATPFSHGGDMYGEESKEKGPRAKLVVEEHPLHEACKNGDMAMVMQLLSNDTFDVNALDDHGMSPLTWACKTGREDIVDLLLRSGASVDPPVDTEDATPPLLAAAFKGNLTITNMLISHGAKLTVRENILGQTAFHRAVQGAHMNVIALLHKSGLDINIVDLRGYSALFIACGKGDKEVIELLIDLGCNVNITGDNGVTALSLAVKKGYVDIVNMLLYHKAEADAMALYNSLSYEQEESLSLLMSHGASVNVCSKGKDASCPIHYAAYDDDR